MTAKKSLICIAGISGRMGTRLVRLLHDHPTLRLTSGLERAGTAVRDLPPHVVVSEDPAVAFAAADVIIDFSAPPACTQSAPVCARLGKAYICASTALTAADEAALDMAARSIVVLQAANLSTGVNVLLEAVELVAQRLGVGFDVEISETHHRHKRDAPSGTALALGQAVQHGRGAMREVHGRAGMGPERAADELGYAAMRGGDVSGDHTVFFFGDGERIELTHRSTTADIFAAGALRAAAWVLRQKPGRYSMRDVLRGG